MPDGGSPRVQARYEAGFFSDYNPSPPRAGAADAEIYAAGARLRDWARYLAKNSSIIKAVLDARTAKGIGPGLRYEPMVRDRKGELLTGLNDAIRSVHRDWSEAADVTGELSRQEVERLVWRDWDTAGEVFVRRLVRGRRPDRLGYQVQLIRSELVPYVWWTSERAVMGVERDEWGAPVTYWVFPAQPSTYAVPWSLLPLEPQAIPAESMVHLRRQEELDATRGVTLFHGVIFRVSDIAEFQQSHRRAARASANLFASIQRSIDMPLADQGDPLSSDANPNDLNLLDIQVLDFLKAGESVNFHAPSHPNQNAVEFVNQELRQIASACRVAFSWIAYVFDRAYAAQRTELVHAWEMIYEDRAHFIRDFALPALYREPLKLAILEGRLPARELRKADPRSLYDVRIEGPVMPSIDPVSDRKAAQIDQEMGWESRYGNIRRFGRDPVQVDGERAKDEFKQVMSNGKTSLEPDSDDQGNSEDSTDTQDQQ